MKKFVVFIAVVLMISGTSCDGNVKNNGDEIVLIKTEFGEIKVKLYDETPQHKRNFLKLVNDGFYNDLLFHRVINNFMIQGGDPTSKNAEPGIRLGGGALDYTVPAEIIPGLYHKRGALAAARKGGPANPDKRSSASQFYIVQGEVYRPGQLDTLEMSKNNRIREEIFRGEVQKNQDLLNKFKEENDREGFNLKVAEIKEKTDSIFDAGKKFEFTEGQREVYTTIGGYPSLDGDYTVFGEVIEGMDVVDKIAGVETDGNNRPVKDIKMQVELVK